MAGKLRTQYPGAIYHPPSPEGYGGTNVMNRGDYGAGRETTVSLKWTAEQLRVGSWKYLSNLLKAKAEESGGRQGRLAL